jgi:hypothetical protein
MNTPKKGETWRDNSGDKWLIIADDALGDRPIVGRWSGGAILFYTDGSHHPNSILRLVSRVEPKREPVECWVVVKGGVAYTGYPSAKVAQGSADRHGGTVHHMREVTGESDTAGKETAK